MINPNVTVIAISCLNSKRRMYATSLWVLYPNDDVSCYSKPRAFSICTEKSVVPVKNQMEQTFPLKIFREKRNTFRGVSLLSFLPK